MSLLAQEATRPKVAPQPVGAYVPDQSRAERTRSFDVADFPLPHGREEEWRFTPLERVAALLRDEPSPVALARSQELPAGVTVSHVPHEEARSLGATAPADRAAVLAAARAPHVTLIDIDAGAELTSPVRIRLTGSGGVVHQQTIVRVGQFATASVLFEYAGTADCADLLTVLVGDGAHVNVASVQEWADDAHHLAQHDVVVGRDATVRHIVVTLGGALVRLNTNVTYAGPGGSFDAFGVYFADAGQHLEHRLFVDHEPPRCRSNVEYKGALQGASAHTVWVGDVLIRASAEGTHTYELNRNLILSDGARADSIPNLEIETGEIAGAGHASTTGRFDDQQLFYLMARGIPEHEARRLVIRGFFASIISRIGVPIIVGHLMTVIDKELESA